MLRVTETGANLVVDYPAWIGLLILALGVALAVHVVRRLEWKTQTFGFVAAAALLVFGGMHFLAYKVTLTPRGGSAYAFPGGSRQVDWTRVVSVDTEQRRNRGTTNWLVARTASGTGLEINVTGMDGAEEQRVREYMTARIGK